MNQQKIRIGLYGFGCVGRGLYDVLSETKGIRAEIVRICVKDQHKKRDLPGHYFTFDPEEIVHREDVDIVVELIDHADAAFDIVSTALRNRKAVVSANKKMIAEHFEELLSLQETYGVPLLYEGATCASIPVIRNLEEYYDNDLLRSLQGIVNGSTNFILSRMHSESSTFDAALKLAQQLGFAESNPALDVEGHDAAYKLSILLAHAFGLVVKPEEIFRLGIQRLGELESRYAREKGYKIKLVAYARQLGNTVSAFVLPRFVAKDEIFYRTDDAYNAVQIEGAFAEKQSFTGKGAGAYPTGSAVLSDISALTYDYRYAYKKLRQQEGIRLDNDFVLEVFVRFGAKSGVDEKDFIHISEKYDSSTGSYLKGKINFNQLIHSAWINDSGVSVVVTAESEIETQLSVLLHEGSTIMMQD
ncbi:MAG: homoserine dehydrogenase [Chitinophagaceae bacterium]|nr:homoserine dehydrogenase [Chitinophagaceae bacterium]